MRGFAGRDAGSLTRIRLQDRMRAEKGAWAPACEEGGESVMKKYECPCGYVYDPEVGDPDSGIAPGTAFEDIPEDWVCPVCGLGKDAFTEAE